MNLLGIDPGKTGAFVLLDCSGKIIRMDEMPDERGGCVGAQTSLLLRSIAAMGDLCCTLEKTIVMPGSGACAMHSYGVGAGITIGLLIGLGIPYTQVIPRQWSEYFHQGVDGPTTKAKSLIAANRRWPDVVWPRFPRSGKVCDGVVDAALIAEWGRIHRWAVK